MVYVESKEHVSARQNAEAIHVPEGHRTGEIKAGEWSAIEAIPSSERTISTPHEERVVDTPDEALHLARVRAAIIIHHHEIKYPKREAVRPFEPSIVEVPTESYEKQQATTKSTLLQMALRAAA